MSHEPARRVGTPDVPVMVMLRGAVIPTVLIGLVGVVVIWVLRGTQGGTSALLGLAVTVLFFGSGLVLLHRFATGGNPMLFIAVGMAVYLGQVLVLFVVMLVLGQASWVDGRAFAAEILVALVVWQVFQIRAWRSARVAVYGRSEPGHGTDGTQ